MANDYKKLEKLGKEAFEILQKAQGMVKPGVKILDVAKSVDQMAATKNLKFAFPINISINENAAHYTPTFDDKSVFGEKDVVKVDIGLRDGEELTDCAITVDLSSKYAKLVEATDKALEAAIGMVKTGRKLNEIGREVEKVAKSYGFEPIRNLGGHGMGGGELHSHYFIPNFDNGDETKLQEDDLIAVEVFLTDGQGEVREGEFTQIFQKNPGATTRTNQMRDVADYIDQNYETYPFALRWLIENFKSEFKVKAALNELARGGAIESFPVLIEKKTGMVAQSEKSLVVEKDSCRIITK